MGIEVSVDGFDELASGRGATPDELASLDERGFVVVEALLTEAEVESLNTELEHLVADDPRRPPVPCRGPQRDDGSPSQRPGVLPARHPRARPACGAGSILRRGTA